MDRPDELGWYIAAKWCIDLFVGEEEPERETQCDSCQTVKDFGIDACCGCAG